VAAVPGDVYSPQSEGVNGLIEQGAALVSTVESLWSLVKPMDLCTADAEKPKKSRRFRPIAGLSETEGLILDLLGPKPQGADRLASRTGLMAETLWEILLDLELQGFVGRFPGGYVRLK
jgi:DNA processing protein